jgi:hypothetical protein
MKVALGKGHYQKLHGRSRQAPAVVDNIVIVVNTCQIHSDGYRFLLSRDLVNLMRLFLTFTQIYHYLLKHYIGCFEHC